MNADTDKETLLRKLREQLSGPLYTPVVPVPSNFSFDFDKRFEEVRNIISELIIKSKDAEDTEKLLKVYDYINSSVSSRIIIKTDLK
jgi:hypothetical protein